MWKVGRAVATIVVLHCVTVASAQPEGWPSEVAGFEFGSTSPHTRAVCTESGHQWRRIPQIPQWNEYDYSCTGRARSPGFAIESVMFAFTQNTLTVISLRSVTHRDVVNAARSIAARLISRHGVPSREERASGTRIWSFASGSQIQVTLNREPDGPAGSFMVTYIRHDHVPPEPSRDLLPEPGF